jgi:hypothetical protein
MIILKSLQVFLVHFLSYIGSISFSPSIASSADENASSPYQRQSLRKSRKRKLSEADNFVKDLSSHWCCSLKCTWKFCINGKTNTNFSEYLDCLKLREPLMNYSEQQFTDWIKERIRCAKLDNEQYVFIVDGKQVCMAAFCSIFAISSYKFHIARESLDVPTIHKKTGSVVVQKWKLFLAAWFINLIVMFCDIMPNFPNRYLPIYFTKDALYHNALDEFEKEEGSKFSYTSLEITGKYIIKQLKFQNH